MCEPSASDRKLRVLSVEDDMLVAMGTTGMLEELGHAVTEAASGGQALALLEAGLEIDLLVTDQGMAGMTGIELLKAVRQRSGNVPIVLVTGYLQLPGSADRSIVVLRKPFRVQELGEAIRQAMICVLEAANPAMDASN